MGTTPPGQLHDVEDLVSTRPRPDDGDGDERTSIDTSPPVPPNGSYPPGRLSQVIELRTGTLVGEYEINGKLGQGGMGVVYSATHPVIGKKAAVKVLKKNLCADVDAVERFIQEARAVNQIGHPNIVDIFAFGELSDGRSYLVMELLTGESLQSRLRKSPLSRDELCHYTDAIARALEAAHDKKIIHRDLKPENVFLHELRGERPIVKLLDFGIAKLADTEDNRMGKTRTGTMMGTPQYISPEQARGYAIDHRADIYSLGVMLFEMLAGRPPFMSDNAMDMVAKQLFEQPPAVASVAPQTPPVLDELVAQLLDKDAGQRPSLARVRAVLDEVRRLPVGDETSTSPEISALTASMPRQSAAATAIGRSGRSRLGLGVAGVFAVIAAVVAFAAVRSMRDDAAPATTGAAPVPTAPAVAPATAPAVAPVVGDDADPPVADDVAAGVVDHAPVAPALPGHVRVRLKAGRGTLLVDGVRQDGSRQWKLALPPGAHALELRTGDGPPWHKTIEVEPGQRRTIRVGDKRSPGGELTGEDDDLMLPKDRRRR